MRTTRGCDFCDSVCCDNCHKEGFYRIMKIDINVSTFEVRSEYHTQFGRLNYYLFLIVHK